MQHLLHDITLMTHTSFETGAMDPTFDGQQSEHVYYSSLSSDQCRPVQLQNLEKYVADMKSTPGGLTDEYLVS